MCLSMCTHPGCSRARRSGGSGQDQPRRSWSSAPGDGEGSEYVSVLLGRNSDSAAPVFPSSRLFMQHTSLVGETTDLGMLTVINPQDFCKDGPALLPSPLQRRQRRVKASSWQGFGRGTGAWLRQQREEAEMAFTEDKSLSQHVNEDHSARVASPRQYRQRYGIKTQTFKNQRDLTLLLVSVKRSVLGSLRLLRLSPANASCNGLSWVGNGLHCSPFLFPQNLFPIHC